MSWKIEIYRAKPNPAGKDKPRYGAPDQTHLLGEWVDLKNTGDSAVSLSTLHLAHVEYDAHGHPHDLQAIYWNGPAATSLQPGQTVRVHTGKSSAVIQMLREDILGVDHHSYAESSSFVLNNKEGDTLTVLWKSDGKWYKEDAASYDPMPAEGEVLVRSGQKLVPTSASAMLRALQRR